MPLGDQKPQLHVSAQQVYLVQEEVHVLPAHLRADHHLAEEVDLPPVGLIAQHQASLLHHPLLNGWGHLHGQRMGGGERPDQQSITIPFNQSFDMYWASTGVDPIPQYTTRLT